VKTNVVTAVRILDKDAGDSPQFIPLVRETVDGFTIAEVSADKAYGSVANFEEVARCGGNGFIAFKENATGKAGGMFEKMFHYFSFKREEYLAHYHKPGLFTCVDEESLHCRLKGLTTSPYSTPGRPP
jgi:hypothetical protein